MEWHVRCSRVQINGLRTQKLRPLPWPIAQDEDPRQEKNKMPFDRLHHFVGRKTDLVRCVVPCM